jgi:hypothetical protein
MPVICSAQTPPLKHLRPPPPPANFFTLTAGAEVYTAASATDTSTMFLETATVVSTYHSHTGPRIDAGLGHWFTRLVGFGVTASFYRADATVNGTYTFPSPFIFDSPVTATASAPGSRRSIDVQFDVQASLMQTQRWQVVVAGGPMYTDLRETLITNRFDATFVFPFTDITLTPTSTSGEAKGHGLGGHLGGSVARHMSPHLDLLAAIDWRHARATLQGLGHVDAVSDGTAVTGGLRVKF